MATKQVRIEEVERGFQYLQGCLDIARTRSTDLSRDFDYVERKLSAARGGLVDRGLYVALSEAVKTCRMSADSGDFTSAEAAISVATASIRRTIPKSVIFPRRDERH